jgi:hypothetical protein
MRRARGGVTVNPQNREESRLFYVSEYLGTQGSDTGWTGRHDSCDPGVTQQGFRDNVMRRINYFRAMAGVPADVTLPEVYNREAQAAALMMSVNRALSHTPPTSWRCYTQLGYDGASSSNLALGAFGPEAIRLYIYDPGEGNHFVGHRRWILYPPIQNMGTGDIPYVGSYPSANALHVFDDHLWDPRPPTREEFVAWPPPGYVPYRVVFARWSFGYPGADFSGAAVSMRCGGESLPVEVAPLEAGFGDNTLVWIADGMSDGAVWPRPEADQACTVTVRNALIDGQPRDFTYSVVVFDPDA